MNNTIMATAADIELLTTTEAAALLKVKRATLLRYWRSWGLHAIKVGRVYMFRKSDIAAWVAANEEFGAAY